MNNREAKCTAIASGNRINLIIRKGEKGYKKFFNIITKIEKGGFFCWFGDVQDEKGKERNGLILTCHTERNPV